MDAGSITFLVCIGIGVVIGIILMLLYQPVLAGALIVGAVAGLIVGVITYAIIKVDWVAYITGFLTFGYVFKKVLEA